MPMRPTKRHFLETTAALASAAESAELEQFDDYEKMLHLLARHKKDLSNIQSMEKRAEYKKQILPDYLPWIEGALKAGTGKQDNVLMMWQVCPNAHLCQTPTLNIKTNGDLVLAVERLFNSLELCKLKEQALTTCIDNYNQTITETK